MLLRSSSTPILGSLTPSRDLEPEVKHDGNLISCPSLSMTSSLQTSSTACLSVARDGHSAQENLKRDLDKGISRMPRVRKVKSENDLQTLVGKRVSTSPAEVAAESLLVVRKNRGFYENSVDSEQKQQLLYNKFLRYSSLPNNVVSHAEMRCSLSPDDLLLKVDEPSYTSPCFSTKNQAYSSTFSVECDGTSQTTVRQPIFCKIDYTQSFAGEHLRNHLSEVASSFKTAGHALRETDLEGYLTHHGSGEESFSGRNRQGFLLSENSEESKPAVRSGCRTSSEAEIIGSSTGLSGGGFGNRNGSRDGDRGGFHGDSSDADEYYQAMLKVDPCNPLLLRNYACFLFEVRKDFRRAEEYLERAILAMPGEGEVLALYATLIWKVHRDADRAANYFDQAVQVSPFDPFVLAANASFIWASESDGEKVAEPFSSTFSTYREATTVSA